MQIYLGLVEYVEASAVAEPFFVLLGAGTSFVRPVTSMLLKLFPILTILIFFSCDSKQDQFTPNTDPIPFQLLSKVSVNKDSTNGIFQHYQYNSSNQIQIIETIVWGRYDDDMWYDTTIFRFEYEDRILTRWIFEDDDIKYPTEIIYIQNQVKEARFFNDGIRVGSNLYNYDAKGKLKQIIHKKADETINSTTNFIYDGSTLTELTNYDRYGVSNYGFTFSYDDKINYVKAISGLPEIFPLQYSESRFRVSDHNLLIKKEYFSEISDTLETVYNYAYDNNDLPNRLSYEDWSVTFEYHDLN